MTVETVRKPWLFVALVLAVLPVTLAQRVMAQSNAVSDVARAALPATVRDDG